MAYTSTMCACGILGTTTEAMVKEFIRHKRENKGEKFWAFLKCPIGDEMFHAFDGSRWTAEEYIAGIKSGRHKVFFEMAAKRRERQAELLEAEKNASPNRGVLTLKLERAIPAGTLPAPEAPPPCKTGKTVYLSQIVAERALAACVRQGREEQSIYPCPDCHYWHLSHLPQRKEEEPVPKATNGAAVPFTHPFHSKGTVALRSWMDTQSATRREVARALGVSYGSFGTYMDGFGRPGGDRRQTIFERIGIPEQWWFEPDDATAKPEPRPPLIAREARHRQRKQTTERTPPAEPKQTTSTTPAPQPTPITTDGRQDALKKLEALVIQRAAIEAEIATLRATILV
jgi:hypothetical protein